MVRQRLIRNDPPLPDAVVLVRSLFDSYPGGRVFGRDQLIADATKNFELFGYYGLSLWAVVGEWSLDRILAEKSNRAARVAAFTAAALRAEGLGLVLSGNAPHVDVTVDDAPAGIAELVQITEVSAEDLADGLLRVTYTLVENDYFVGDKE
ncbi:MAG: hypothetical protein HZY75_02385 [Nocardioidaceae bacterium]|nr:MAG: hypothetical protein HZY75_02385 [Nocardioidaceae bacterium]